MLGKLKVSNKREDLSVLRGRRKPLSATDKKKNKKKPRPFCPPQWLSVLAVLHINFPCNYKIMQMSLSFCQSVLEQQWAPVPTAVKTMFVIAGAVKYPIWHLFAPGVGGWGERSGMDRDRRTALLSEVTCWVGASPFFWRFSFSFTACVFPSSRLTQRSTAIR